MILTILMSAVLAAMALILGAFAWKMRQQEQFLHELMAENQDDVELLHYTSDQLVAARKAIEELEFQLHLKESDLRIMQDEAGHLEEMAVKSQRAKRDAQQLLEIHRMQNYSNQDAALTQAMFDHPSSFTKPKTRPAQPQQLGEFWEAKTLLESELGATQVHE